ncbi:MAG TPA: hypothetical protein VIK28_03110 [Sedimentisphaerales bacterium]
MDSQTAILTPAQLTHFADFLDDSIKRLRGKGRQMRESVTAARAVWKDAKYDAFQQQLNSCVEDLEKFNNTGMKYADFLREKANLANKYLHRQ